LTAGAFSTEAEGGPVWAFVISGFLFNFFVADHNPPQTLYPLFLQPDAPFVISVEEMRRVDSLYEFACGIGAAEGARRALQVL